MKFSSDEEENDEPETKLPEIEDIKFFSRFKCYFKSKSKKNSQTRRNLQSQMEKKIVNVLLQRKEKCFCTSLLLSNFKNAISYMQYKG